MPMRLTHSSTAGGGRSMLTPSARNTSALPLLDEAARLPCLATVTPAPATTNAVAVEILNVPLRSPPVPQVSTTSGSSTRMRTAFSRMTRTDPTTSSTVSPFIRNAVRYAAIWAGVAAPSMISRITPSASASESETRSTSFAIADLISALTP